MKSSYYGDVWWGYVARLERVDLNPNKVVKVGITNAINPMMRLEFRRDDEPFPITNYFTDIKVLKQISFKKEFEAERWERKVMGMVKRQFGSPKFHNWKEDDPISGITEMRSWKDNEVEYILSID